MAKCPATKPNPYLLKKQVHVTAWGKIVCVLPSASSPVRCFQVLGTCDIPVSPLVQFLEPEWPGTRFKC